MTDSTPPPATPSVPHVNEIRLVGRVSAAPEERVLPSGDGISTFRLVVDRPRRRSRAEQGARVGIDTFDVFCWTARTRRRAAALHPGDVVLVEGSLQRRFFRSAHGVASRYQVDAERVLRQGRAG